MAYYLASFYYIRENKASKKESETMIDKASRDYFPLKQMKSFAKNVLFYTPDFFEIKHELVINSLNYLQVFLGLFAAKFPYNKENFKLRLLYIA